jgi:hypothetical protein
MIALLVACGKAPTCGRCGKEYDPQLTDLWLHMHKASMRCSYCREVWGELRWSPAEKAHPRGHYHHWTLQDKAKVREMHARGVHKGTIARMLNMPLGTVWYMLHA